MIRGKKYKAYIVFYFFINFVNGCVHDMKTKMGEKKKRSSTTLTAGGWNGKIVKREEMGSAVANSPSWADRQRYERACRRVAHPNSRGLAAPLLVLNAPELLSLRSGPYCSVSPVCCDHSASHLSLLRRGSGAASVSSSSCPFSARRRYCARSSSSSPFTCFFLSCSSLWMVAVLEKSPPSSVQSERGRGRVLELR